MTEINYLHVQPGGHCLRCHLDYKHTLKEHECNRLHADVVACGLGCDPKWMKSFKDMPKLMPRKSVEAEAFLLYCIARMKSLIEINKALVKTDDPLFEQAKAQYLATLEYVPHKMAELYDDYAKGKEVKREAIIFDTK